MKKNKLKPIRDLRRPVFEFTVPTYILDLNYRFRDWNRISCELVAKPLGLSLGMHAIQFVEALKNRQECMERSGRVFSVDSTPVFDCEPLIFQHPEFGEIQFEKLASQIRDFNGSEKAWVVSLNLSKIEKSQELFTKIGEWIQFEICCGMLSTIFNQDSLKTVLKSNFSTKLKTVVFKDKKEVLCMGMPSKFLLESIIEVHPKKVTVFEFNEVASTYASMIAPSVDSLMEFLRVPPEWLRLDEKLGVDVIIIADGLWKFNELTELFSRVRKSLTPNGEVLLWTLHQKSNPEKFTNWLHSVARAFENTDFLTELNGLLWPKLTRYTLEEVRQALEDSCFRILDFDTESYGGQLVFIRAVLGTKPKR